MTTVPKNDRVGCSRNDDRRAAQGLLSLISSAQGGERENRTRLWK